MDDFRVRDGRMHAEDCELAAIADRFGTPTYVYSRHTLVDHLERLRAAWSEVGPAIRYAVKANGNLALLQILQREGAGFDVVSRGEIERALRAGADPASIDFAGVGKRDDEIDRALEAGIGTFNVESPAELEVIEQRARAHDTIATIALRVNPDVDAHTHRHITTGREQNKFGVAADSIPGLASSIAERPHLRLAGLHLHIGSQLTDLDPYEEGVRRGVRLARQLLGQGVRLGHLNLGGGFGIHYVDNEAQPMTAFAQRAVPLVRDLDLEIRLEPGRLLIGNAGVLLTRVLYVKDSGVRRFVICDAGMSDLMRPTLYDAFHRIEPVVARPGPPTAVDIVGPICETADTFARQRPLPPVQRGDVLCIRSAGAYGFVLANHYNARPRPAEVLVDGARFGLVRERETTDDLIRGEHVEPVWHQ